MAELFQLWLAYCDIEYAYQITVVIIVNARILNLNFVPVFRCHQHQQQAVWPLGSADTVYPRPSLTLTFDRLTLKLVCELHLRGSAVERRSLTGELSLSCARPAADA